MKPTVTILVCVLATGLASAQSPSIIQNTRNTINGVSDNATAASNQALGVQQSAPASVTHATRSNNKAVVMPAKSSGAAPVPPPRKAHARRVPAVAGATVVQPTIVVSKGHEPAGGAVAQATTNPDGETEQQVVPDAKYNANGRRDPFVSPVVSKAAGGSGCSTGKKCLEIGEINLRGVVHGETGFIAVVSNGLNKAYFLRENDPVFNGYVVKITGDSIVFQETLQDRLGKTFTREVVKKITTPAV